MSDLPDGTYMSESKMLHSLSVSFCKIKGPAAISSASAGGAKKKIINTLLIFIKLKAKEVGRR